MKDLEKNLEEARADLERAVREKEVLERRVARKENRLRNALRKKDSARTHRLIVEGAELEYVFDGIENLPQEVFWAFMRRLVLVPGVKELFELARTEGLPAEGGDD